MTINIRWNEPALDKLLNNPKGEVGRHMRLIGVKILAGAKTMAGEDTGELRRKLYMKQYRRGKVQAVEVGSTARHAYWHHEGTKPHQIVPETGRLLRFNVGGKVVYARRVSHPGTKGVRYLTTPMRRALR